MVSLSEGYTNDLECRSIRKAEGHSAERVKQDGVSILIKKGKQVTFISAKFAIAFLVSAWMRRQATVDLDQHLILVVFSNPVDSIILCLTTFFNCYIFSDHREHLNEAGYSYQHHSS